MVAENGPGGLSIALWTVRGDHNLGGTVDGVTTPLLRFARLESPWSRNLCVDFYFSPFLKLSW